MTDKSDEQQALKDSIAHWERLLELYDNQDISGIKKEGWDGDSCALCTLYFNPHDDSCVECPVKKQSGKDLCIGTPWYKASSELYDSILGRTFTKDGGIAIQAEIDYLRKLLD